MSGSHYLVCLNDNCERPACVDRRTLQNDIKQLRAQIEAYQKEDEHESMECFLKNMSLSIENGWLRSALTEIDQVLTVPAAEYVPAIRDAFDVIDRVMGKLKSRGTP